MTIGQKIKELRKNHGLLQKELALKLKIGEGYLSKVENNQKTLNKDHLVEISHLFNYPISDLEILWLGTKVYDLIKEENDALRALKVAEENFKYNRRI